MIFIEDELEANATESDESDTASKSEGPNLEADGGSDLELANGLKEPDLIPAESSTPKPPFVSDASSSGL